MIGGLITPEFSRHQITLSATVFVTRNFGCDHQLEKGLSGGLLEDLLQTCGDNDILMGLEHVYRDEKPFVTRAVDASRYDRWLAVG